MKPINIRYGNCTWRWSDRRHVYISLTGVLTLWMLIACTTPAQAQPSAPDCPLEQAASVQVLVQDGGRVDWSHTANQIAYDKAGDDGYYDVYVMAPDGSGSQCLTCDNAQLAQERHYGNPAWHPAGQHIVFQGEKAKHWGSSDDSKPGFGRFSDLYLIRVDDGQIVQLTNIPLTWHQGVLHPHFSPDGTKLVWGQMVQAPWPFTPGQEFGYWEIKIADFGIVNEVARLTNVSTYTMGSEKRAFYETHGFSPDGKALLFSSNYAREGSTFFNMDIFRLDLESRKAAQLTNSDYNEHAHFSPDGQSIVWMSNRDKPLFGTDYWIMEATTGAVDHRLTGFNLPNCPGYEGTTLTAADVSWGPDVTQLVGYVQSNLLEQVGKIVLMEVKE